MRLYQVIRVTPHNGLCKRKKPYKNESLSKCRQFVEYIHDEFGIGCKIEEVTQ